MNNRRAVEKTSHTATLLHMAKAFLSMSGVTTGILPV
jgi:hypothetical protein